MFQFLWYEFQNRDTGNGNAISELRQLERIHVDNLADVKGRSETMELSLSHLGRDLKQLGDRHRHTEKQWEGLMQQHLERYFGLDGKLGTLSSKVDSNFNETMLHMRSLDKDIDCRFNKFEGQLSSLANSLRDELAATKNSCYNQIDQLDAQYQQAMNRQREDFTRRLKEVEKNAFEAIALSGRQQAEVQTRVVAVEQRLKGLEQLVVDQVLNVIEPKFAEIKDDMKRMFSDVREAIDTLEHVEDGKMKLLEDRINREVGELRKFVVLV